MDFATLVQAQNFEQKINTIYCLIDSVANELQESFSKGLRDNWDSLTISFIGLIIIILLGMNDQKIIDLITSIPYWQILISATIIGMLGSAGYLCLLLYKFLHNDIVYAAICPKSCKIYLRAGRIILYVLMGGAIAAIFQIPENPNFVPIQAFVLGTTWPAIVAQALSGAQKPDKGELKASIEEDLIE